MQYLPAIRSFALVAAFWFAPVGFALDIICAKEILRGAPPWMLVSVDNLIQNHPLRRLPEDSKANVERATKLLANLVDSNERKERLLWFGVLMGKNPVELVQSSESWLEKTPGETTKLEREVIYKEFASLWAFYLGDVATAKVYFDNAAAALDNQTHSDSSLEIARRQEELRKLIVLARLLDKQYWLLARAEAFFEKAKADLGRGEEPTELIALIRECLGSIRMTSLRPQAERMLIELSSLYQARVKKLPEDQRQLAQAISLLSAVGGVEEWRSQGALLYGRPPAHVLEKIVSLCERAMSTPLPRASSHELYDAVLIALLSIDDRVILNSFGDRTRRLSSGVSFGFDEVRLLYLASDFYIGAENGVRAREVLERSLYLDGNRVFEHQQDSPLLTNLIRSGHRQGIARYVENRRLSGAATPERIGVLEQLLTKTDKELQAVGKILRRDPATGGAEVGKKALSLLKLGSAPYSYYSFYDSGDLVALRKAASEYEEVRLKAQSLYPSANFGLQQAIEFVEGDQVSPTGFEDALNILRGARDDEYLDKLAQKALDVAQGIMDQSFYGSSGRQFMGESSRLESYCHALAEIALEALFSAQAIRESANN